MRRNAQTKNLGIFALCLWRAWKTEEDIEDLHIPWSLKGQGHEIITGKKWYGMMGLG